jgi:protein SCO1/2
MLKWYAAAAVAAVVAGTGGTWLYTQYAASDDPFAPCRSTSVAGGAASIGGPFTLVSETGETVTEADVITKPSLIYFGYTFCPDVCPLDTVRNAEATDLLQERGYDVQPVFISVDHGRDTPETMADYTDNLHPDMLGLTGSEEQLQAATKAYAAYFRLHDQTDEYYLVDHSTFTYLMLPGTGFAEFYRRDMAADAMAESVACFLDAV